MNKITIIGCPGSGKSTLSFKLEKLLKFPVLHLDKIYHIDNTHHISRDELVAKVNEFAIKNKNWIIDGNYISTVEQRIKLADTIIILDIDTNVCVNNALDRTKKDRGADMAAGFDNSQVSDEFINFIKDFKTKSLPKIMELVEVYKHEKQFLIFNNYTQIDKFLEELKK